MPSAANVKVEKQVPTTENALGESGNAGISPLRQAITIIEHKIRNLEKRKSKLESYRDMQTSGKELNSDQKTALAKIDEVIMTLDFARDLYKQFLGIASTSEKDAKKQAKREASLKNQAELARLREILLVQDALNSMGTDSVRNDFLNGRNGAAQLTESDLKLLDDLYPAVTPKHESGNPTTFTNHVQGAAEHLLAVVDGKPKEIFGGTYSQIKEILGKIHESGYFDQAQETLEDNGDNEVMNIPLEQNEVLNEVPIDTPLAAPIETLTIETANHQVVHASIANRPPVPGEQPVAPILPPHQVPPVQPAIVIDPTLGVPPPHQPPPPNEIFYQPQPQHAPRQPLTEVLGTGSFFFLQESEIDTPDQIPTQTFTNQTFVVQPPPPIPLPPHFQPQQVSPGTIPPMVNHQGPPSGSPLVQQSVVIPGNKDDVSITKSGQPQSVDDKQHSLGRGPPQPQNRNAVAQNNHQSFYNNGYSNRSNRGPQQSRNNGVPHHARSQTNRH